MTPAAMADSSVKVSVAPNGCTSKNESKVHMAIDTLAQRSRLLL